MMDNRKRPLEEDGNNERRNDEEPAETDNAKDGDSEDVNDEDNEEDIDEAQQQSDEEFPTEYYNEEDEEEIGPPRPPDEFLANRLSFHQLAQKLEKLWKLARNTASLSLPSSKKKLTQEQKVSKLFDEDLKKYFARRKGSSLFPLLRLILPNLDNTRGHLGLKEKAIATAWTQALGFRKNSEEYNRIMKYVDPAAAGASSGSDSTVGDISLCIQAVLAERQPSTQSSKVTVEKINELFDELAAIKRSNHNTMDVSSIGKTESDVVAKQEQDHKCDIAVSSSNLQQPQKKPPSKQELRKLWVQKLRDLQFSVRDP